MNNPVITELSDSDIDPKRREEIDEELWIAKAFYQMELAAARKEGFAEGFAKGFAQGLAEGRMQRRITLLAEALGIELDQARRDEIDRASLAELEALLDRLRRERRW